jgi:hypothetical protein
MIKEEIIAALKNALERNQSLDEASKTLSSAGYNPLDVQEAVRFVQSGALKLTDNTPKMPIKEKLENNFPEKNLEKPKQNNEIVFKDTKIKEGKSSVPKGIVIGIILLIFILLVLLAFVLFGEKILDLFA